VRQTAQAVPGAIRCGSGKGNRRERTTKKAVGVGSTDGLWMLYNFWGWVWTIKTKSGPQQSCGFF